MEGRAGPGGRLGATLRQVGRVLKGQLVSEDRTVGSKRLCAGRAGNSSRKRRGQDSLSLVWVYPVWILKEDFYPRESKS